MTIRLKLWTGLGLGVALASGGLAACAPSGPSDPSPSRSQPVAETDSSPELADLAEVVMGEGEGGEGEGGVNFAAAASDPVVYGSALAIAGAHALAAIVHHAVIKDNTFARIMPGKEAQKAG